MLASGDAGLQRVIKWLYKLDQLPQPKEIEELGQKWAPYRSVAVLYLWEAINRGFI
ncbi:MAG: hypothetical protein ACYCX4_16990 [Bacillota bacterium]